MTLTITYDQALEGLNRAVEEKGADYRVVTGQCVYFNETTPDLPSCLIGYVLHYLGLRATDLLVVRREYNQPLNCNVLKVVQLYQNDIITSDDQTKTLLIVAQDQQDCERTWGEAVARALEVTCALV